MGVSRSSTSSKNLHWHGNELEKLHPWSFLPNFQATSLESFLSPVTIDYCIPGEEASDSHKFSEPPLSLLEWCFSLEEIVAQWFPKGALMKDDKLEAHSLF